MKPGAIMPSKYSILSDGTFVSSTMSVTSLLLTTKTLPLLRKLVFSNNAMADKKRKTKYSKLVF